MSHKSDEPAFPLTSAADHQYCGMSLRDNEALLLLASARKGVARMIADTGKFIVVGKT